MTVRTAEIAFAVLLALCSIGLMIKSSELNIGWIEGKGPGAGAWPFWLSAGMLLSCLATIVRWFRRITPESRSTALYLTRESIVIVGTSGGALLALLLITQFAGIYVALPLFLLFYVRVVGGHTWALTVSIAIALPLAVFALFEWALQIPLPKAFTDEWFYPAYDLMYASSTADALAAMRAPIVGLPILAGLAVLVYWSVYAIRRRGRRRDDDGGGEHDAGHDGGHVDGGIDGGAPRVARDADGQG